MEACLLSLSTSDIAAISERYPVAAVIWKRFKENIQKPIAVILIVNTLSHTIGASVAGASFKEVFGHPKWLWLFSLVFSMVMIQYTELLPKTLGIRFNRSLAVIAARPLSLMVRLFHPVVYVCDLINRPFSRRMPKSGVSGNALDEIRLLAGFARVNHLISKEQETLLARTIQLSNKTAREIMVDREEMKVLSSNRTMAEALVDAHVHHHTRYPLVEDGNLDRVLGYVNMKDIVSALKLNPHDPSLKGIVRPVRFIMPEQSVASLLRDLTKGFQHMAVIRNVAGATVGMVTLEDLLEEVVGEIEDEYDVLPTYLYPVSPERYLVGGGASMRELAETTGTNLPDQELNLNDWLQARLPGHPKSDVQIMLHGLRFSIRKLHRSKIYEVIVDKPGMIASGDVAA